MKCGIDYREEVTKMPKKPKKSGIIRHKGKTLGSYRFSNNWKTLTIKTK